ncbi:hypothetical protein O7599_22880 [Streptomyces sp. WMMC500]|uniref:hypothetical protein n=1 Tax=Streptomyces sp. WMMC500 TaxID=3015154 RepID=UPI00248C169A|nr:hypothetical protein [Streptomyces sp. WMMC500]WBB58470.1 hypothetical protein O7599_22880 [Streptomyces sp. WMMC500]
MKDDGRQAVLSALPAASQRTGPATGDRRVIVAWLRIHAPYGATPTATSTCRCGRDCRAAGRAKVLALIEAHTAHRDACPLRSPEGRKAA